MKHPILLVAFLLLPLLAFSQGVTFEQGSWKDALALAKQTNKPVFVEVHTSWCKPCKMMSADIFPLKSVGDVYNKNFVCYQIDAEIGEGVELAKQYNVTLYPTFLFVKADGTLFSRASGSKESNQFIEVSKVALLDIDAIKPLFVWEAEYPQKMNDSVFLLEYLNKRSSLGLPSNEQFDMYLNCFPRSERLSERIVNLYKREGNRMIVTSLAYYLLLEDRDAYISLGFNTIDEILCKAVQNSINDAIESKDEALMNHLLVQIGKLPVTFHLEKEDENEPDNLLKYASHHCNNNLMKIDPATKFANDKTKKQLIQRMFEIWSLESFDPDSVSLEELQEMVERNERIAIGDALNSTAYTVFQTISNVDDLKDALRWSDRSLQFDPKNAVYLNTNANLLYKLGRKEEAIKQEKLAKSYGFKAPTPE